jgi:hypothetical protein
MGHATRCVFALAVVLFLSTALFAGTASFITGDVPYGTATQFSDTNNGLTATFSSPADPGGFYTSTTFFSFGPQILVDPGPAGQANIPLDIAFSAPQSNVSMNFAIDGPSGPLQLNAYLGGSLVGSTTVNGAVPPGWSFPEGVISFAGGSFDSLSLSSPDTPYFAVANIDVPEPSAPILLATALALAGAGLVLRRKLLRRDFVAS